MIIVKIIGGLGNQLFQYYYGQSLKKAKQQKVVYDISGFESYKLRNFTLGRIYKDIETHSPFFTRFFKSPSKISVFCGKLLKKVCFKNIKQKGLLLPEKKLSTIRKNYLEGYYISHVFLDSLPSSSFQPLRQMPLTQVGLELKDVINGKPESCFLHIRRGDYKNADNKRLYEVYDSSYYEKAIQLINQKYSNTTFFLFSDDLKGAREEMPFLDKFNILNVSDKNLSDIEELSLMATCRNGIISNSTFSWWGAYLIKNQQKTIVAPSRWINHVPHDINSILPPEWMRL